MSANALLRYQEIQNAQLNVFPREFPFPLVHTTVLKPVEAARFPKLSAPRKKRAWLEVELCGDVDFLGAQHK